MVTSLRAHLTGGGVLVGLHPDGAGHVLVVVPGFEGQEVAVVEVEDVGRHGVVPLAQGERRTVHEELDARSVLPDVHDLPELLRRVARSVAIEAAEIQVLVLRSAPDRRHRGDVDQRRVPAEHLSQEEVDDVPHFWMGTVGLPV